VFDKELGEHRLQNPLRLRASGKVVNHLGLLEWLFWREDSKNTLEQHRKPTKACTQFRGKPECGLSGELPWFPGTGAGSWRIGEEHRK